MAGASAAASWLAAAEVSPVLESTAVSVMKPVSFLRHAFVCRQREELRERVRKRALGVQRHGLAVPGRVETAAEQPVNLHQLLIDHALDHVLCHERAVVE